MIKLVDEHIRLMHSNYPDDHIVCRIFCQAICILLLMLLQSYVVLSGGFGSSPYVRQRLVETLTMMGPNNHPNAEGIHILVADEP